MKKLIGLALCTVMAVSVFAGCTKKEEPAPAPTETPAGTEAPAEGTDTTFDKEITVISREDGSGTRGAFVEITGVEEKNEAGEKVDNTTVEAVIANSTSIVTTTVAGDDSAIGYISLGSLNDTVKALQVDGVEATAENVKSGTYSVARPFNIVKSATADVAAEDFIAFILSAEGQAVVEASGYISEAAGAAFATNSASGKVVVAGSSSVTPVMQKLKEAYAALNPAVEIEIQENDSTTGMNAAKEGICDIGMASRELKDSEKEAGLEGVVIAIDGIAVIVNNENPTVGLTKDQVKGVFTGELMNWNEVQ